MLNLYNIFCNLLNNFKNIALLLLRASTGLLFAITGFGKLSDISGFASFLESMNIPFAVEQAYMVAGIEFVGGICLILGLFTQLWAIPLAGIMIVALLTAHSNDLSSVSSIINLIPWNLLLILIYIACAGGGSFSIDSIWQRVRK